MPSTPSSTPSSSGEGRPGSRRSLRFIALAGVLALAIAGVVAVVVASSGGTSAKPDPRAAEVQQGATVNTGDVAPDFTLETLSGKRIRLSDYKGRPVMLNFWASWCNPCRQEFPLLQKAYEQHRTEGLVVIGVVSQDIASDARDFVRSEHATWPMADDTGRSAQVAYGVRALPQTIFVGRDGRIAIRYFLQLRPAQLSNGLRKILAPPVLASLPPSTGERGT